MRVERRVSSQTIMLKPCELTVESAMNHLVAEPRLADHRIPDYISQTIYWDDIYKKTKMRRRRIQSHGESIKSASR